jgi:predicted RNA-binding protein with PIN domain
VRAAREWARRARAEARAEVDRERKRTEKALRSFEAENARRKELEAGLEKARGELDRTKAETQRSLKQARRSAERAAAARDEARAEAKAAHRQVTRLERTVEELRGGPAPAPRENETDAERARGDSARRRRKSDRQPAPGDSPSARPPRVRSPLPVPKGMFDTDPMTLNAWLASPNVTVLVDGYNVTKHERGFGDLTLEAQRERLREELDRLARRYGASATIVFDGAQLPPGTSRRRRGKRVRVEYSEPPESGDDRLVAVLGAQPNFPVIVVTGDRGLQERVRELGATVASAGQLLGLIR